MNASKFCVLNFQEMFVTVLLDKLAHTKFLKLEKCRDKDCALNCFGSEKESGKYNLGSREFY